MTTTGPTGVEDDVPSPLATLSRRDLQERALRGSLWSFALVGVSLPLGLLANAILARRLQPEEYGYLALLLVVYAVAQQLTDLGFVVAQTQWGVQAATRGDDALVRRLLSYGLGFRLLAQFPLMVAVGAVLLRNASVGAMLAWSAASLVAIPLGCISMSLLFENRTATVGRVNTLTTCVVQLGVIAVAFSVDTAVPILLTRVLLDLASPAILAFLARPDARRAALRPRLPTAMPDGFWRFAGLAGITVGLQLLVYSRSEVFVFRAYDELHAAGLFALAFGLAQQLTAPLEALLAPLMPAVAGLVSSHPEHAWAGTLRALRLFAVLAGGAIALVPALVFAVPVIFGSSYTDAAPLLVPLGVIAAFQSLSAPITVLAYARRHGGTLASANAGALVLDMTVAFALIPLVGIWGGVAASALARLTSLTILLRAAIRQESLTVAQLARHARAWFLALPSLPCGLIAGVLVLDAAGRAAGVVAALLAGAASYTVLLRTAGGGLHAHDASVLVDTMPARLRGVVSGGLRVIGVARR